MDAKKLRDRIIENELNMVMVARRIGISEISLRRKLNGSEKFTIREAKRLKVVLGLTNLEALEIFL